MSDLAGTVTMPKNIFDHDLLTQTPANPASAFADLWRWANDRDRTVRINNRPVFLKRGQLGWAQTTLARVWRWDAAKVKAFLVQLQNEGLILLDTSNTTTIITVIDYVIYNQDTATKTGTEPTTESGTEPVSESATKTASEPGQKGEEGKVEEGKGNARDPHFQEIEVPGESEFLKACELRGIPMFFAAQEFAWRSERPADRWPRGANWQTAVTSAFTRWQNRGAPMAKNLKKNGNGIHAAALAPKPARSAAQEAFELSRDLERVRERLDAAHETSTQPDPADVLLEKKLERLAAAANGVGGE